MIIHIPHSSTKIPDYEDKMKESKITKKMIEKYTDFYTSDLFFYEGADIIEYPYSRVFCDVEKLEENEPQEKYGLGILYKNVEHLRKFPQKALETYKEHHKKLLASASMQTAYFDKVIIIDAHSFSEEQAKEQGFINVPDICIGTDDIHTPKDIIELVKNHFESNGYSVGINTPYSGTIVPLELYGHKDIISIMIELNKKTYMNSEEDYKKLKNIIYNLLKELIEKE
jgi:N-formylglutamate deformylase